jgi:SAM-dependent methyltransferase
VSSEASASQSEARVDARQVRGMFDRIAGVYDLMNSAMTAGLHHRWRERAADRAELDPGDSALDVCCGTGDLALELAGRVGPQGSVIGCDFSEPMLELARRKAGERGSSTTFEWADALALPYETASFDAVTVGFGVRNLADLDRGVAELARVLRAGGRLVAVTNGPNHLAELWALVGVEPADRMHSFRCDTGEEVLGRSFGAVERRQIPGHVDATHEDAVRYLTSSMIGKDLTVGIAAFDGTLRVQTENCVFVATKA